VNRQYGRRRASRQRGDHIAQHGFLRLLVRIGAEVNQAAIRAGVLERMNERGLPAGEQRSGEDEPRDNVIELGQRL